MVRTIRNGAGQVFRKGRVLIVESYYRGFGLRGQMRKGRRTGWITRVSRYDIELLPKL